MAHCLRKTEHTKQISKICKEMAGRFFSSQITGEIIT
jgi:hypothetical protein